MAVDRFEGNTQGKVAVVGLLEMAGLSIPTEPGSSLGIAQKINRAQFTGADPQPRRGHSVLVEERGVRPSLLDHNS